MKKKDTTAFPFKFSEKEPHFKDYILPRSHFLIFWGLDTGPLVVWGLIGDIAYSRPATIKIPGCLT